MKIIQADARKLRVRGAPKAHARIQARSAQILKLLLEQAVDLAEVEESGEYLRHGFASVGEYAGDAMHDPWLGRSLCQLGKTLKTIPQIGDDIRAKLTTLSADSTLGWGLSQPGFLRPGDEWREKAK